MDFWRTIEVLEKRKWLILLSVIAAVALTFGATRLTGSKWIASVEFVSPETVAGVQSAGLVDDEGTQNRMSNPANDLAQATIYDTVVKSRDVVQPVMTKLGYSEVPAHFAEDVVFRPLGPNLYSLDVTDPNLHHAQDLANDLAQQFMTVYQRLRTSQAQEYVDRLQQQLNETTIKLTAATTDYDQYRLRNQIVGTMDQNLASAVTDADTLSAKRDDASAVYERDEAAYESVAHQLASTNAAPPTQVAMTSPLLEQERNELENAQTELDALTANLTDSHPSVIAARSKRDAIRDRLADDSKQIAASPAGNPSLEELKDEVAKAKAQATASKASLDALNVELATAKDALVKYTGSDTGANSDALRVSELVDMRKSLDERLNAARLALDDVVRQNPITVMNWVNAFNPPVNSTQGRTVKLTIIAAFGTLLLACGIIIGLDRVDRRVKNMREAEISLPTRMLAAIPQPTAALNYSGLARITETHPMSLYSESYRFLGLHLLNGNLGACRSIMTLSAKAEQGSTTTLTNLGITLAQAGKRVIMVDANMRTAELHAVFGVANDFGFTDLLASPTETSIDRALHETTVTGLRYITSGTTPENAWALFRSGNLQLLSQQLKNMADYVLYDTPSSLMFTDALNLAPVVDGAILCVRAFQPLTGAEQRIIDMLEQSDVKVLGSVLNDVPTAMIEAFANYEAYYENALDTRPAIAGTALVPRTEVSGPPEVGAGKNGFTRN